MSGIEQLIREIVRDELDKREAKKPPAAAELVTVLEYARARSISERTVRQAIADGRLPVERIGRAVRIRVDAVIAKRKAQGDPFAERARAVLLGGKGR